MLQTQALKYFAEVARSGSLRHASEVFDIVPSAISRQIAQIEQQLGVSLFERSTRGMALTEAGAALLEFADDSERHIGALRKRLADLSELQRGSVRLAVVEAVTHDFLPRTLASFSSEHPGIEFAVSVCGTNDVAARLSSHTAEIGMTFNSPPRDDLLLRARIPQPLQLICRPGHPLQGQGPLSMKGLDGLSSALPDRSFGIRRLIEKAEATARIRLRVALESDSLQLIKNVVAVTDLVSFMPPMTFTRELALGELCAIDLKGTAFSQASIEVLTGRGHDLSQAAQRLLGILIRAARQTSPATRTPRV